MPKSTQFSSDLLKLIFNATPIANLADNAAASPVTTLHVSLHTADPSASGNQSTNEVSYTGYARITVARAASRWSVTGNAVTASSDILFGACTDSGAHITATHASVGMTASGAGEILYSGALSDPIVITAGTTPVILAGAQITES